MMFNEMQYKVVPVTEDFIKNHIDEFIAIASDIPKEAWIQENYLYELPGKWQYSIAAVAITTNKLAGFIIASDKGNTIHIHKYATYPQLRSKGIGILLLHALERNVKLHSNTSAISLFVDKDNIRARAFYERNGFYLDAYVDTMASYKKQLSTVIGIHQPNFFPWLGFFHKMATSDKFILLNHVENDPSDGIYTKRVTIVCNNQPFWLSVPLEKAKDRSFMPINEMKISAREKIDAKHLRTIAMNYKRTPFFGQFFYLFEKFYQHDSPFIAERNIDVIREICNILKIDTPLYLSSSFEHASASNQMLVDLIKKVGGKVYLHGSFAVSDKGYQDNDLFLQNGIALQPQQFKHPVYQQYNNKGAFIAGASIVDALMNIGAEGVQELLNSASAA